MFSSNKFICTVVERYSLVSKQKILGFLTGNLYPINEDNPIGSSLVKTFNESPQPEDTVSTDCQVILGVRERNHISTVTLQCKRSKNVVPLWSTDHDLHWCSVRS